MNSDLDIEPGNLKLRKTTYANIINCHITSDWQWHIEWRSKTCPSKVPQQQEFGLNGSGIEHAREEKEQQLDRFAKVHANLMVRICFLFQYVFTRHNQNR